MFSVTKTELNVFPLCTKKVWPTKSGVTIERRDQVLIGLLTPDAFILSIFSRRCDSTKGPFFNDLAINCQILLSSRAKSTPPLRFAGKDEQLSFLLRPSPFRNESIT